MSGEREFFKTRGFWITVLVTLWIVILVAVVIFVFDERTSEFCWTGECFNNLIDIYTVPLGIGSVGLAILALLSYNHRSAQTARSLQTQEEQNSFANYYNHLANFRAFAEEHIERHSKEEADKRRASLVVSKVYKEIYPNASPASNEFKVSVDLAERLDCARQDAMDFTILLPEILESNINIDEAFIAEHRNQFRGLMRSIVAVGRICHPDYRNATYTLEDRIEATRISADMLSKLSQFEVIDDKAEELVSNARVLEFELALLDEHKEALKLGREFREYMAIVNSD